MSTNRLGPYHIIRELARSNDIVYEAKDPATGGKVALKELQIPPNLTGQARAERIARFRREAQAAQGLQHPNIVRILDRNHHDRAQDRYYIAMEFLEGQSLRDILRQRSILPLEEALRIATAVADGLACAHRNGVIHRDVKPDNVHIEPDRRVVITDFGIARLSFEPTLTADGQIFGTPSYMSPEQVTGKGKDGKDVDARSDLFSLGVMLYEMVSGRKPFTGDSVITITWNIMNLEPPPLAGVPEGLNQVIRRALAKDRDERYRTAGELVEDLKLVAQGRPPIHALAPTPATRQGGPPVRQPAPLPASRPPLGPPPLGPPPVGPPGRPPAGSFPPAPAGAGRPLPPANWGGPAPGSVPGARPMAGRGPVPVNGAPRGAYPPGVRPGPVMPGGSGVAAAQPAALPPVYQRRRQRPGVNSEVKWFLGWLAVAVLIGLLIVGLVALVLHAMDTVARGQQAAATQQMLNAANDASNQGRQEEALRQYTDLIRRETDPAKREQLSHNAAKAAQQLAAEQYQKGRHAEAEASARRSLRWNPDLAPAYYVLALALAAQDKVDESIEAYDEVPRAEKRMRRAGAPEGDLKAAEDAVRRAADQRATTLYNDGVAQLQKDPNKARERFRMVIDSAPGTRHAENAGKQLAALDAGQANRDLAAGNVPAASPSTGSPGTGANGPTAGPGNGPANGPGAIPPGGPSADPDLEGEMSRIRG